MFTWLKSEGIPIDIIMWLPFVAVCVLVAAFLIWDKNTLHNQRCKAFTSSLLLGVNAVCWGWLASIPEIPWGLLFLAPEIAIPMSIMILFCSGTIFLAFIKHPHDFWLIVLAVTSISYPVFFIAFGFFSLHFITELSLVYGLFTITSNLWWFSIGKRGFN